MKPEERDRLFPVFKFLYGARKSGNYEVRIQANNSKELDQYLDVFRQVLKVTDEELQGIIRQGKEAGEKAEEARRKSAPLSGREIIEILLSFGAGVLVGRSTKKKKEVKDAGS